jgi:Fe-S cluster biogenesis protein NfuA/nitrite reductase/ring-hydroxylating ferredoxin subunit
MTRVRQAGERIEELLARLRSADGGASAAAEELVRLLLGLYGDGLSHIMDALDAEGAAGGAIRDRLLADPLVESLLLLHDLHPLDVDTRIQRALDRVRPYLGSHAGGVQYLGVGADGVARLRLEGSCHGCPSSTVTVQLAIQGAVEDAAPEVTEVVVEGMTEPPGPALLQIGRRPPDAAAGGLTGPAAGEGGGLPGDPGWVSLPAVGPPDGRPAATVAGGVPIVVCSVRGTLYAYYDACAACGASLAGGTLTGERLDCPGCGAGYDVRSAGRSLDDPGRHLDPLPLLSDSQGIRVALPAGAAPGREPAGEAVSR